MLSMSQAIQQRLNALAANEKVRAAWLVMYPQSGADEYRYLATGADGAIWDAIAPRVHRFKANGAASLLNEPVECGGQPLQLLAASYGDPSRAPFMIAATLPLPEAFDLSAMRNALEKVARACMREADSIKWK